ncbi:MAG: cupin domain-containing protein [Sphingomonadales bacterium]|nr:cupin domain-containing protein [Sphingomonadales bacterium]MBD3773500.1 cupin domain-containing protein [Paracoccaceae bacterium]
MSEAEAIIAALDLQPHPEGGWYRETWRAPSVDGARASATAIHFLLQTGESSHWHRVDAAEIWLWHAGDRLELALAATEAGPTRRVTLGPTVREGEAVQHVIPADEWQAARPLDGPHGYVLVSCIVSPGFEFGGFTLAPPGWAPDDGASAP